MAVQGIRNKVLTQVCIIVRDAETAAAKYTEVFGFPKGEFQTTMRHDHTRATYHGKPTDARAKLTGYGIGRIGFELLQPLDAPTTWMDHLTKNGDSIHHVAFYVPKTDVVAESFKAHGYTITQQGLFTGQGGMYTYLDTDRDLGLVIELLEHYKGDPKTDKPPMPADRGIGTDVVTQVGVIVKDIEKTARRYGEVLGLPTPQIMETAGYDVTQTTFRGKRSDATARLAFINLGQVTIELIQPDQKPSVWREFLERKGEGAQHIAFEVKDTKRVVDHFARFGIGVAQQGLYSDKSGMYTYLDSQAALGTTVELLESYGR